MSLVAKEAQISKGLIYNYFENKDALVHDMIDMGIAKLFCHFELENMEPNSEMMKFMIDETFRLVDDAPEFWSLYFAAIMQPGLREIAMESVMDNIMKYIQKFVEYFENKGAKDALGEAMLMGAILDGISLNYIYNPQFPVEYVKQRLYEIFL